jgi:flagellar motor switch protein FliG
MTQANAVASRRDTLTGPERVAIVMLAVGKDHAAKLIERFEEGEQRDIVRAMAAMGLVPAETVERVLSVVVEQIDRPTVFGSLSHAEQILSKVMPAERVRNLVEDLRGAQGWDIWEKLQSVPDAQLAAFLRAETPQLAAFVVTKLPPAQAGRVLQQLPPQLVGDIVKRVINLTPVAGPIVEDVERVLHAELLLDAGQGRALDNHAVVAAILDHLDDELGGRVFETLEREMPESAGRIRALTFTFEDLRRIDEAGIQTLIREIPNGMLPLALKGAAPEMVDLFLRNMAERGARMIREEIESMPKVRVRDVETARGQIVEICKQLMARGEIASVGEQDSDWIP